MVSASARPQRGASEQRGPGAVVAAVGVALPPSVAQEELWNGFFAAHYAGVGRGLAKRVFANSGVVTRHAVVNPAAEDLSGWPTSARMERYIAEALPLGKDATSAALGRAGVAATEIGMLVVCSCTGYVTPGLDILLARDLGLAPDARRVFVGHMGCYAALPGLGVAADYVALNQRPAVVLCVELTSLHVQPPTADPQQVVAHALFSDAAAAVVLVPSPNERSEPSAARRRAERAPGGEITVREVASRTDTTESDHMSWHVTDLGFRMGLSPRVPEVLSRHVGPFIGDLLSRHGLEVPDVAAWAVHPGGPRILDVTQAALGLPDSAMAASRECLAEHGNCSSPTVLLILDRLLHDRPASDGPMVLMAFGPGLTVCAALLH